mmetsp:Transcript_34392/g.77525  ORF Transcript_34392/g.77525 Transcript_34392/m.77525 type:complete len:267 (-) Transcript_34392:1788-2588(-)
MSPGNAQLLVPDDDVTVVGGGNDEVGFLVTNHAQDVLSVSFEVMRHRLAVLPLRVVARLLPEGNLVVPSRCHDVVVGCDAEVLDRGDFSASKPFEFSQALARAEVPHLDAAIVRSCNEPPVRLVERCGSYLDRLGFLVRVRVLIPNDRLSGVDIPNSDDRSLVCADEDLKRGVVNAARDGQSMSIRHFPLGDVPWQYFPGYAQEGISSDVKDDAGDWELLVNLCGFQSLYGFHVLEVPHNDRLARVQADKLSATIGQLMNRCLVPL